MVDAVTMLGKGLEVGGSRIRLPRNRRQEPWQTFQNISTEGCKIITASLNFRGLAPASLSYQPQPDKSAFSKRLVEIRRNNFTPLCT